ncbi:hypothetical protein [Sorangium sp. So ce1097]|uniref:hypothetical protein n=1 Tax=Sorangium sp. So ce1097 TaxID=3133330 RepID=UPI003F5E20E7
MSKKKDIETRDLLGGVVDRRQVLIKLGAFAITAPGIISCGDEGAVDGEAGGGGGAGGAGGTGGSGASTTSASTTSASTSASSAASGGEGGAGAGGEGGAGAGGEGGGGSGDSLIVPPWDSVPMCMAFNKTDGAGQGPFFIHELEKNDDISLIRQDIRGRYNESAAPGVEMHLHLRVLDLSKPDCNGMGVGLPDVDVYIWHTDGQGFYSGFGARGTANEQNPDSPYAGRPNQNNLDTTERFCRGVQTTDANGVVSFRSIFPGWYNGRDVHIHFVCFKKGSMSMGRVNYQGGSHIFTTQFYFDPAFTDSIHTKYDPYKARTTGNLATAYAGAILADERGNSGLRAKAWMEGDIAIAQMQIAVRPT